MSHHRDSETWEHVDWVHPEFAKDIRNVKLDLCTDGFSPFGMFGKQYSSWPVILTPYNLFPWMCMKNPVIFLIVIIPDLRNPKHRVDVYLQPLIDELQQLWSECVTTYDISKKQNFQMRAALLWTINDFLAYGMLSGWSTAERLACPYCMGYTKSFYLQNGRKQSWFDCHRHFLPLDHPYRSDRKSFRNDIGSKASLPVEYPTGEEIWASVYQYGKITKTVNELSMADGRGLYHNWEKRVFYGICHTGVLFWCGIISM